MQLKQSGLSLWKLSCATGKQVEVALPDGFEPRAMASNKTIQITGKIKGAIVVYEIGDKDILKEIGRVTADSRTFPKEIYQTQHSLVLLIGETSGLGSLNSVWYSETPMDNESWQKTDVPAGYFQPVAFDGKRIYGYSYGRIMYRNFE